MEWRLEEEYNFSSGEDEEILFLFLMRWRRRCLKSVHRQIWKKCLNFTKVNANLIRELNEEDAETLFPRVC